MRMYQQNPSERTYRQLARAYGGRTRDKAKEVNGRTARVYASISIDRRIYVYVCVGSR